MSPAALRRFHIQQPAVRSALGFVGQALFIAAALFMFLRGWDRDFRVPLAFASDSLLALMQSKSTVDNGWWWFNHRIGAPFGLDALAFPANSNVDQAFVWLISRVVGDPMLAANLAWGAMVVASGLTGTWCLRTLGSSRTSALVAGTLFALTPYALYRQIDHLWMVIYLVPFVCAAALLLATGGVPRWRSAPVVLLTGCALLGFDYVYYAFFGCFVVVVASAVGAAEHGPRRIVPAGLACVAVICAATVVNLAPSLRSWSDRGKPLIVREKVPAEAEVYGLKLRHLVSPLFQHRFPPFRAWTEKEAAAQFPIETENMTSRLGLIGSTGFSALLAVVFAPRLAARLPAGSVVVSSARLALAAVLLATIGGFGSVISLLVTSQIRAYNRIEPFIAFFALVGVAALIDAVPRAAVRRLIAALVLLVGLLDQRMATIALNAAHPRLAGEMVAVSSFVRQLEARLPADAMVLQLPFRTFLNDSGVARMEPYDHLKLYLLGSRLRWSYPALSNEQVRWQLARARLEPHRLAAQASADGFAAIVIDRYGYDDGGAAVTEAVAKVLGATARLVDSPRYLALDLRSADRTSAAFPANAASSTPASSALPPCGAQPLAFIDQIGGARAPFAVPPRLRASSGVKVGGWAVDQAGQGGAAAVDIVLDGRVMAALHGFDRNDVAAYLKSPVYLPSGFVAEVRTDGMTRGAHTLALRVVSRDSRCYYEGAPVAVTID